MDTVGMSMGSVPLPQSHTATILTWQDLDLENCEMLLNAAALKNVKQILADIFKLNKSVTHNKEGILLSLYAYAVHFAREEKFTVEQLSAYFSIVKRIHEVCTESPFGNLTQTFNYFKDLLISHSVCRPPYSVKLFSKEEVTKIAYHVINTYFRNFNLYKYAFTQQVRLDLVLNYANVWDSDESQGYNFAKCRDMVQDSPTEESVEDSENMKDMEAPTELGSETEFEPERYLTELINMFLQDKMDTIRASVKEQLKHSEHIVNIKLEEVLSRDADRKAKQPAKKGAHKK
ncbi:coiled-coil domain-containing protein 189-like [Argonauta hians]